MTRSGLFGPWDAPDLGFDQKDAGINPAGCDPWGLDSFQLWPNFTILVWGQNWYLTYHYWPVAPNEHVFEGTLYFVPAKNARERVAHENAAVTFKEFGLAGRQHARGDADDARVTGDRAVPSDGPGGALSATCTRWRRSGWTTTRSSSTWRYDAR